ncbi:MAG: bifunctional diguanylate cyclase/phosphodiesterase [Lachnospiraceae bacterium]|nr:bifunctional diguanylate cyclase/phosphodiesterase [Lachnospiraceae bacterium]
MVKRYNNIDKTLHNLSLNRETPKSAFILLLLLYGIGSFLTIRMSTTQGYIMLNGIQIGFSAFAGAMSMLANICIICLVTLFRRVGYFVALTLLLMQFPFMLVNIFVRGNHNAIPGFFSNILIIGAISIIHFSYRKILRYQNSIREQAVTDGITGLPNRFACGELMANFHRRSEKFALVSIDLNNFKSINDTMGHDTGDEVLRTVAARWKTLANSQASGTVDFIARNSGDEFMLVINDFDADDAVERSIEAYKNELEKKITIDDCDYYLTACFGYAIFPDDTDIIENLYLFADAALHEIKKTGGGSRIMRFTPDVLNTEKTLEIERKIRTALNSDKIFCNLQPQYDIEHRLRGFEALARMKDDDGTYISPVDFIPVAEKTGLVDRIDMRVFELAMDFIDKISGETGSEVMLSVNVSVRHLMKNNFIDNIKRILETHSNVAPGRIEIEITESIMIDSAEKALQRIDEVKALGMKVAIDDFGTGYSSLSYLNNFPSDMLKIDKSFIDQMNLSSSSRQYVAMIISLGHILNLKVISEGVETPDQVATLKEIGCDYIQGFVWGKPMSTEDAGELVRESVKG